METTIGGLLVALYLGALPLLWKTIDRKGRPGLIASNAAIETVMLVHIAVLLAGITLILLGLHDEF